MRWDNSKKAEELLVWTAVPTGYTATGRGRRERLAQVTRLKGDIRVCLCPQKLAAKHTQVQRGREESCFGNTALKTLGKEAFALQVKGAGNKSCHVYTK